MRSSLFKRLWESSPGSICRALNRRYQEINNKPAWHKIKSGPLAGNELFFPNPTGGWKLMMDGTFDNYIYRALDGVNLKGACCWDIGAHFGYHSMGFAALGANVVAFEPNPFNIVQLQMNLGRNPGLAKKIRHVAAAVSDCDGETPFVFSRDVTGPSSGSHLHNAKTPSEKQEYADFETTRVKTMTIDTLIRDGEPAPDVMKIDVEGAEQLVLDGGKEFFSSRHPILLMEIHHICLMFSVQNFLKARGYQIGLLDGSNSSPSRCFIMAKRL